MVTRFLILFSILSGLASGQATRPPDTYEQIRHAGGAKTAGQCLVWDANGRVISQTCAAGGGEINTASNLGSGANIFASKVLLDFRFRSLVPGSNRLSVTQNANDISLDIVPANMTLSSLGGSLNLSQLAQGGATTGQLIQWNGTAWAPASVSGGGGPANTDALAEGSTNLYFTNARTRAALSVSGILSYDNGTGIFSCPNCVSLVSSYANPSWISSLAYAKITGVPAFELGSNKGIANGYASLGSGGLVPAAQLGTGTANSTNFLRGDGAWTNPSGSVNVQSNGSSIGTRPGLNFVPGTGTSPTATDDGANNRVNVQLNADTSVLATRAQVVSNADTYCLTAGTSTAYTCAPVGAPLAAYATGQRFTVLFHAESGASPTINISTLGARKLYQQNGTTQIAATDIALNFVGEIVYDATLDSATGGFRVVNLGGGGSAPTPINAAFYPTGPTSGTGQYGTGSADLVRYWAFNITVPTIVRNYKFATGTTAPTIVGFGLYTSTCDLVAGTTATESVAAFTNARARMSASVTLQPGLYYLAVTGSATGDLFGDSSQGDGALINAGEGASTFVAFAGSNSSSAGVTPPTCGTRTSYTGTSKPAVWIDNQ
jgi:hypothetical protein